MTGQDIAGIVLALFALAIFIGLVIDVRRRPRELAPLTVTITADTSKLERGLRRAAITTRMFQAHQTMMEFDRAMQRIREVTDVSASELERFAKSFKALSLEKE